MHFGERLVYYRKRKGLTQQELEKAARLSSGTVSRLEKSPVATISLDDGAAVAIVLGVGLDVLVGFHERVVQFDRDSAGSQSS